MPRLINRSVLFNLVRTCEEISRAELARITGLQRSTVSLIVQELIAEGWVIEGATGKLPRGRSPMILQVNTQRAVIAVDIHPAQSVLAVCDLSGQIVVQHPIDLRKGRPLGNVIAAIRKILAENPERQFVGIGITLPGRTDVRLQKLIFAPNVHWPLRRLKERIEHATGLPVQMDNVANACALAEVWFGQSDGLHDLVVVNVSEGLGTGIYANGQILRGESGMAGEFGHVQIDPDGPLCACGNRGCWEMMASNRAAVRYYKEFAAQSRTAKFEAVVKLAENGDPAALKALDKMARNLGRGMRMIASALAPREIVVVGHIAHCWDRLFATIKEEMSRRFITKPPHLRCTRDPETARLRSAIALVLFDRIL